MRHSQRADFLVRPLLPIIYIALLAATGGAQAFAAAGARLDHKIVPVFESFRLELDPAQPLYKGSAHVDLSAKETAQEFAFHARDIAIDRLTLKGKDGDIPVERTTDGDRVRVRVSRPLQPGAYGMDIDFTADFNTQAAGLYRMKVDDLWYAFTQFEATDARGAIPCWDEPEFKIPFQMTLVVPEGHLAIGNTPIEHESVAGGRKTCVFEKTPPLPSYLLAIATGPLETVPIAGMSIPGRIVTVKGAAGLAGEAAKATPPLVAALEKYFGIPYPYRKLDLLAVPEFWPGAMENAGAITFADGVLLIDPQAASAAQKRSMSAITAHELAHMWFGDLVTMRWWDDLWLNESFASWMGDKVADQAFPDLRLELEQVDGMQTAMTTDARRSTHAMRQPVSGVENLDQLADELAYDKGQAVLTMFERWLGEETFRKGVVEYLKSHRWGNATASDLWSSLSKAAGRDVAGPMATFLDQPGVPIVRAEILPGNQVRLSQKRLLNDGGTPPAAALWQIPVTLKYSQGGAVRTKTLLLKGASQTIALGGTGKPAWLHPNAGETGYYRWQVAPEGLALLAGDTAHLSLRERMGYIGNLKALLDAGQVRGDDDLRLLGRFADDERPEVIGALLDQLGQLKEAFIVDDLREPFVAYVRETLSPALRRFGREKKPGEDGAVSLLRPRLLEWLGDEGQDEEILDYARTLARSYVGDPSSIDPALAGVALDLSALRGDAALFKQYRKQFERTHVPADRRRYLSALGAFRDPEIMKTALDYAVSGPLRPQEMLSIPEGVASRPENRPLVWDWVTDNFQKITGHMPPNYGISLVYFASGCSQEMFDKGRAFFSDAAHAVPGIETEIAKVSDRVADCVRLRRREEPAVAAFLRDPKNLAQRSGGAAPRSGGSPDPGGAADPGAPHLDPPR